MNHFVSVHSVCTAAVELLLKFETPLEEYAYHIHQII